MSRFAFCNCPAGFSAPPERHAPDCPGRSGAGKPRSAQSDGNRHDAQSSPAHPDDSAVDRFAAAMKVKLAAARAKGRDGWADRASTSDEFLAEQLVQHLAKGNVGTFEDVANFAMMLHQRDADPQMLAGVFGCAAGGIVLTPEGQEILAQCVAGYGYVLGVLVNGRPDLALIEAKKWVDGFRDASAAVAAHKQSGGAA